MPETIARPPQTGSARFGSAGVAGAGATGVAVLLGHYSGMPENVALAISPMVGFVAGGFLGSLGKFARDKAAIAQGSGDVSPWTLISWVG